jgi:hypothetical protein
MTPLTILGYWLSAINARIFNFLAYSKKVSIIDDEIQVVRAQHDQNDPQRHPFTSSLTFEVPIDSPHARVH